MNNNEQISLSKPITMIHADFMNELVKLVNESKLPFFIIESSLKEFIGEVHDASIKQLEVDKMKYNQQLAMKQDNSFKEE